MLNIRPGRLFAAAALVAFCIAVGLSAPLVFDFDASEFKLSNVAVFAAPRGGHEITSPVDIAPALRLRLERGTIAFNTAAGEAAPDRLPPNGSAKLVIDGGIFQIAGRETSEARAPAGPPAALIDAVKSLNFEALIIRRSTVKVVLPDGHDEVLTDVVAEVANYRRASISIRGTGNIRGQSVNFELSASGAVDPKSGLPVALKVRLKSPLLELAFDGRAGSSEALQVQGRMELAMGDVRQTARWLGAPWPSGSGLRNAAIKGDFDWQGPALAFDKATFRMDGNEATGTLALSFAGERPALTGTFAMPSLDLTPYVASGSERQIPALLKWARSDESIPSTPLGRYLDADVRASAAQLLVGSMAFGRFAASLSLKKGRLLADIAEIDIDGGRGSGQVTADLSRDQPQIAVRGRLEEVDASRATTALLGHSAVQGLSTITVDLATEGNSADLLNALRGKVTLNLHERGRIGIDVKSLMDAAQNGQLEGWGTAARGQTSVDGLEAKLRVDKGIVASELVEATVGDNLLRAIGTISLGARQMDLRIMLDQMRATTRSDASRDILVLRGPWAAPSIAIER